jgi:HEAT repeat protein
MPAVPLLLFGFTLAFADRDPARPDGLDLARLREMLHDRQNPRTQSQAALLLVEDTSPEAAELVRQGLKPTEDVEVFLALAAALRVRRDDRFLDELIAALTGPRPGARQAAAEALAELRHPSLPRRLREVAEDPKADPAARQAAVWALGRCGRKEAAAELMALMGEGGSLRQSLADALAELSGHAYGLDAEQWQAWWARVKNLSDKGWLEMRLAYQASRARRLEGDLERSRAQVLRLQQQLYARLPAAERGAYVLSAAEQDDAASRALAVAWAAELLAAPDAARQAQLGPMLLRLSRDAAPEVKQAATLGLSRVGDPAAGERLRALLHDGRAGVRAAAARALAQQARAAETERKRQAVAALQRALDDPALEVVVEAAEGLGSLGALEAGPVLLPLLQHPSESVRRTAAQSLERVADAAVLDGLLSGLGDPAATVRFSLVGAAAHAAGDGASLSDAQRKRLQDGLAGLLQRDPDGGVRSRAASVLGECASPEVLPQLWKGVVDGEDGRVQEKAWAAFVEVVTRSGQLSLLREWDRTLQEAKQGPRRLQLLAEASGRWQKHPQRRALAAAAQEMLIKAELEQGKWQAALPQVLEQLGRPGADADPTQRLRWLLAAGEQALKDGDRAAALRAADAARPHLAADGELADAFERLRARAEEKK